MANRCRRSCRTAEEIADPPVHPCGWDGWVGERARSHRCTRKSAKNTHTHTNARAESMEVDEEREALALSRTVGGYFLLLSVCHGPNCNKDARERKKKQRKKQISKARLLLLHHGWSSVQRSKQERERERERAKPSVELLVGARDERTPCLAPLVVEHGFGGSLEHGSEGSGGYMVTYAT